MEEGKFLEGKISGEGNAVERKLEARVGRIVGDAELQVRGVASGRGESAVRGWRREVRTTKLEGRVQDRENRGGWGVFAGEGEISPEVKLRMA